MRKKIIALALILGSVASAQVKFGVKAGLSFGYNGNVTEIPSTVKTLVKNKGEGNVGFHIGGFSRIKILTYFIQPEVYYSQFKTTFVTQNAANYNLTSQRIDVPVLGGFTFLDVARVGLGPVFSLNLKDKISVDQFDKISTQDFSVGGQIAAGVDISDVTLDARYEFGLGKTTSDFINATQDKFTVEKRPSMLLLSVGYKF